MSAVGKAIGHVLGMGDGGGGGGDAGAAALAATQAKQQSIVDANNRNTALIEEGQRRVNSGTGGGLLAFLDDELKKTFGG